MLANVNQMKRYGENVEGDHVNNKILWILTIPKFNYMTCVLKNSNDLETMTIDGLFGRYTNQRKKMLKRQNKPFKQILKTNMSLNSDGGV